MHHSFVNLVVSWSLIVLSPHTTAFYLNQLHPTLQLPLHIPQQLSHSSQSKSWLSYARDSLIHTIWPIPPRANFSKANRKDPAIVRPPPTLLARYGGDLVLRFDISSVDEAEALSQAINVLFLDVWEFTTDWVDIRLSKDVVSSNRSAGIERTLLTCPFPHRSHHC